ncbi:MAG TPA: DUF1192 domain-containing protein [Alphaproteobacteria bacterium]|jgi:uncharacterized small protein (DUF1192 family)|nr:DUF1192 domain-containing protein [Alphaproteobacteria bacterium]MDP6269029.1 DUF1192 domain-containing protein [Alphaproteobacteria bacterium]HJM49480.1 DUF1192 domain-containing protein [Alphaproteobacteria bacterium]|tara:strand:+ start:175 stop:363 length:189 start_codon:yes stop_codon:yes gene_type:complete
MSFDDDEIAPPPERLSDDELALMSVGELNDRIAGLEAEIERARQNIAAKQEHRGDAESFFKS